MSVVKPKEIVIPVPALSDDGSRRTLQAAVGSLVSLAGQAGILLDLSGVERIDPEGVATLLSCRRTAESAGGSLDLAGIAPRLRVVLELVRLHHVFPGVRQARPARARRMAAAVSLAERSLAA